MALYRIRDWESEYENNRTRELKKLDFVLVPNRHDGDGFRTLISKPRGTGLFGAWVLILQVASKCDPRGTLIRSDRTPHTAETIARMTGGDPKLLQSALDVLTLPEIGWIENVSANTDFETPPSRTASAPDKRKANGRIDRHLVPGRGVITPKGKVTERPEQCQWCECTAPLAAAGMPGIVAHHLLGYGNLADDLAVMFVCRSCHGLFESGKYTTAMVIERYGSEWMPQNIAGDSDVIAGDSGAYAGIEQKRTEGTRTEGNGTQEAAAPQRSAFLIPLNKSDLGIEGWDELCEVAAKAGMSFDPDTNSDLCQKFWRFRDFENRKNCIQGICARIECRQYSPDEREFVPTLENYVRKNLWRASLRPRNRGQPKDKEQAAREQFDRLVMRDLEDADQQKVHSR